MNEYLRFEEQRTRSDMLTKVWAVRSTRHGNVLGFIRWYGAWRQYTFWPEPNTIWNLDCLEAISGFINEKMTQRKVL